MSDTLVAQRYAQALYDTAQQTECLEDVDRDVALIRDSLSGSRELVLLFDSPIIPRERKLAVIRALFRDRLHQTTMRFMELLVEKRREDIFRSVVQSYGRLRDEQLGVAEALARSAQSLSSEELETIRSSLESMTGKSIRLRTEVDHSLVGGLVVRIGDMVYDGSVRNKLQALREQFRIGSFRSN